jgi:hypothetical protein
MASWASVDKAASQERYMVRIVEMDRPPAAEPRKMPETVQFKGGHAADIEFAERGPLRRHHGHVPSQRCCGTLRGRAPIDAGATRSSQPRRT